MTGFAEAAVRLDLADPSVNRERLAQLFLGYLNFTTHSWLVVLDNLNDAADLAGLWPSVGGQVILTTRRRDATISGAGRTIIDVGVFTEPEANTYLQERIALVLDQLPLGSLDDLDEMAEDLGRLPLALAQAAAVIINEGITCAQYRVRFADQAQSLEELFPPDADADGYARTVATTWELAIDAADRINPLGLARPMAIIVALLDPVGVPEAVLTSQAIGIWLSETIQRPVTASTARSALRALYRLSLIDHDPNLDNPRAVRMHNLTGRAIVQTLSGQQTDTAGQSVANGILSVWPRIENNPRLSESLRSNTAALANTAPNALWNTGKLGVHTVLLRAGNSLLDAGPAGPAIHYHQQLHNQATQHLGPDHTDTLTSRNNLARAYHGAGKVQEAIQLYEQVLTDQKRVQGLDHPDTLSSQNNLAGAYESAGRTEEAITLYEQALADRTQLLGADHSATLTSRNNLAAAYLSSGNVKQAISLHEQLLTDRTQTQGPYHPDTLTSQNNLASVYHSVGRVEEAIVLYEQVLTDQTRVQGLEHPNTMTSRNNLASAYESAGRVEEAIVLYEQVLTDRSRVLGSDHPNTLTSRNNLASAYGNAGRADKATVLHEQGVTDSSHILGTEHPHTLTFQNNLAMAYRNAGRVDEAIVLHEYVLTERTRVLGPDHPATLTSWNSVATAYLQAGRAQEAIQLFEQVLTSRTQVLGPDHPHTLGAQNDLASAYYKTGRVDEAILMLERVLIARARVLGPDHPKTQISRNSLASARKHRPR